MLRKYQADSQEVLDRLFNENLIPFKLEARMITEENRGEFRVYFHDSRLHSVILEIRKNVSIMEQLRLAVLLRLGVHRSLATPLARTAA